MKMSARQDVTLAEIRRQETRNWNSRILQELENDHLHRKLSEEMAEKKILSCEWKIAQIIPLTFEEYHDKFGSVVIPEFAHTTPSQTNLKGQTDPRGYRFLYLYAPELQEFLVNESNTRRKIANIRRITKLMEGHHLPISVEMKEFLSTLPADIPYRIHFDGSKVRVARIAAQDNTTLYGNIKESVFAVADMSKSEPVLHLFVKEIDFQYLFAKGLERIGIPLSLAEEISVKLPHDRRYYIQEPFHSKEKERYALLVIEQINRYAREDGDPLCRDEEVNDLAQGLLSLYEKVDRDKPRLALDFDDEKISVVLIGNRIYSYIPD